MTVEICTTWEHHDCVSSYFWLLLIQSMQYVAPLFMDSLGGPRDQKGVLSVAFLTDA
jgi:hypothetical protein